MTKRIKVLGVHGLGDHRKRTWQTEWREALESVFPGQPDVQLDCVFATYDDIFEKVDLSVWETMQAVWKLAKSGVTSAFGRRGVLVVISDFYEDPQDVVDAVTPLRFRGNDLIVFHVLDPAELEFGFSDAQAFEDLETGEQMPVVPDALRKEYIELVKAHTTALQQAFSQVRVDYALLDTSKPLDHALYKFLGSRTKRMRR